MEALNAIGAIHYWGYTPAIDFLRDLSTSGPELNVLLSGTSDIRHVLRSLASSPEIGSGSAGRRTTVVFPRI